MHAAGGSANVARKTPEPARTRLALLRQLEASLFSSRNALLALDLAAIERGTREQTALSRKLAEEIARERLAEPALDAELKEEFEEELEEEFQRSARGVLQAVRLQSALLMRAQGKLRVLANVLAGPGVNYGPPPPRSSAPPPAFDFKARGES